MPTCMKCGNKAMTERRGEYVYDPKGVAVRIRNAKFVVCAECGEEDVVIARIEELRRLIADILIRKKGRLVGAEIRFLRKFVGFSGKDFAEVVGVAPETVSRWENDKQPMEHGHQHALRLLAARGVQIEDYALHDALKTIDAEAAAAHLEFEDSGRKWKAAA